MVLNSPIFLFLFLPITLVLLFAVPRSAKNPVLLLASLLFCAWGDAFSLWVLTFCVLANYSFGLLIERAKPRTKKIVLGAAVGIDIGVLLYCKYAKFAVDNLQSLGVIDAARYDFSGRHLPLGISFFTFSVIAYLIDIYRSKARAEGNPLDFGLFVALFPKIIAGPIVRYKDLSGELKQRKVTLTDFAYGVRRFVIGLGKKVLIANMLGAVADAAFRPQAGLDMPTAWLGILCYTLQIYFDFSGYSDMAIGLGRMLGFTFMENFNYPYISQSIQEFWRRWHISLSTWFRDYLYIPLGGNRGSEGRTYLNLVLVFLLCGFWHGASWNFIVWGGYYGLFLVLERLGLARALQESWRPVRHLYACLVVMIGWVFFRAEDLPQAVRYLKTMFSFTFHNIEYFYMTFIGWQVLLALAVGLIGSAPLASAIQMLRARIEERGAARLLTFYDLNCSVLGLVFVLSVFMASLMQLAISTYSPFIYTKF